MTPLGTVSHIRIDVSDLEASLRFYCGVLGFDVIEQYDAPPRRIAQVGPHGQRPGLELWYEPLLGPLPATRVHIALLVEDVGRAYSLAMERGAVPLIEPFEIGTERIAFVRDPDGYPIELHSPDVKAEDESERHGS
jgi:catechol 2,3-dioxygenase